MQFVDLVRHNRVSGPVKGERYRKPHPKTVLPCCRSASKGFVSGWRLPDDKSRLCQMAAKSVDEFRSLSNEGFGEF